MSLDAILQLRAALTQPPGTSSLSRTELVAVLEQAEMAARLRPYVVHRAGCASLPVVTGVGLTPKNERCNCGLADVLAGRIAGQESMQQILDRQSRAMTASGKDRR